METEQWDDGWKDIGIEDMKRYGMSERGPEGSMEGLMDGWDEGLWEKDGIAGAI